MTINWRFVAFCFVWGIILGTLGFLVWYAG